MLAFLFKYIKPVALSFFTHAIYCEDSYINDTGFQKR